MADQNNITNTTNGSSVAVTLPLTDKRQQSCQTEINLIKKQSQEMLMLASINEAFATENKILVTELQNSHTKIAKLARHFDILMLLALAMLIIIIVLFVYSTYNHQQRMFEEI